MQTQLLIFNYNNSEEMLKVSNTTAHLIQYWQTTEDMRRADILGLKVAIWHKTVMHMLQFYNLIFTTNFS